MKSYREKLPAVIFLVLLGCAPYKLQPLTMDHPADPKALTAPAPPPSKTLAYTDADKPSAQPVPMDMKMEMMMEGRGTGADAIGALQTVVGEGSIVAVVASSGQLVLDHAAIPNFMDAMTMGYRVESASVLEGLKAGDPIRFTIDKEKKVIIKVEKLKR